MGFKDIMKNVTDKASAVAGSAQAKYEEQKQYYAIKKEEQNKKMEENYGSYLAGTWLESRL